MATIPKVVTYEEWLNMPEVQDAIEEVVNGEIRIMPPPKWLHFQVVERLASILRKQIDEASVLIGTAQFGLVIRREPLTSRVPDLAMFSRSNIVEQDGYIHSAPELIAEVLSPSNTRADRADKLRDYESRGVPEVWVLSPEARTVELLQLEQGKLHTTVVLTEGQIRPKHFPKVAVEVASIWPD